MKNLRNKKGFTLAEILIVVVIIGILAVVMIPSLFNSRAKARDSQRINDLKSVAAFLQYQSLQNSLPTSPDTIKNGCIFNNDNNVGAINGVNNSRLGKYIRANLSNFKGRFPTDPSGGVVNFGSGTANACYDGGYYLRTCPLTSPYKYVLFAKVEVPKENGNAGAFNTCPTGAVTPTASTLYYAAFVKK